MNHRKPIKNGRGIAMRKPYCTRFLAVTALAGLALLATGFTPARAETVTATTTDWAPYYGSDLESGGVVAALARAAFEVRGHALEVQFMPWNRAFAMAEQSRFDAVLGAYYSEERDETFTFSEPFYEIEVGIMAKKAHGITHYDSLRDLSAYTIGYNDGYGYGEAFENADYLKKDPAANQTFSVRKFLGDRVDMVAMGRGIFRYEAGPLLDGSFDEVVFLEPPLMVGKLHMMFSPEADPALRQDFDAGLAQIQADGTYQAILNTYGF